MPTFTFTARDAGGQWHNGTQAADNTGALAAALRARSLSLVKAQLSNAAAPGAASNAVGMSRPRRRGILSGNSLDVEMGLQMLANMLEGGLTLMSALKTCAEQARRPRMAGVWDDIHDRVAGGMPFADALERHKQLFPKLVIQLARAGEVSGNLDLVLEQAAEQMEKKRELMVTVISAMMYPAFATVVALGVTAYLMVKVIPDITGFLLSEGKKLPAITQALIDTSKFVNGHIIPIGIVLGAAIAAVALSNKIPALGRIVDPILLRIPIVGKLYRLAGTSMFARGMAMLLDAGVPMLTALETAGGLMKNTAISRRVEDARRSVLAGNSLARPLGAGMEFMPMLARMVAVGEETGTLSGVLLKVANFHEKLLQSYIKRMTLLIEPVMTIVVGGIVGFVYLAFFFAIYSTLGRG